MHFAAGPESGESETYRNIALQTLQYIAANSRNNGWGAREADGRSTQRQELDSASVPSPRQELEEARARSAKVSGEASVSSDISRGRHISGVSGVSGEPVPRGRSYHSGTGAESTHLDGTDAGV